MWPRSYSQPPPLGYELCGCDGCENKTWEDHILNEDDDDETSPYGNLHLEYIQYDTDDDDDEMDLSESSVASSNDVIDDNDDDGYYFEMSDSSDSLPYPAVASESYDLEC